MELPFVPVTTSSSIHSIILGIKMRMEEVKMISLFDQTKPRSINVRALIPVLTHPYNFRKMHNTKNSDAEFTCSFNTVSFSYTESD